MNVVNVNLEGYKKCGLSYRFVKIAHKGHMGIVKCKVFLRSNVWFPKMLKRIEK